MCGIAGIFHTRDDRVPPSDLLRAMGQAIRHRGPDDDGVASGPGWGLASRRLSIIGVATGHMPLANEDGSVTVVFNGEIYNYRAIRERLIRRGHVFRTGSDTEVLVHLYEERGDNLVLELEGMFAFAIVDSRRRRILLARDRLGQKPLYYSVAEDGTLVFGSELAALRRHPSLCADVDRQALYDYLSLGCIPSPRTIYSTVRKLPPACRFHADAAGTVSEPERYWTPRFEPKTGMSFADAAEETRERLEAAVAKRMEAEVPLGAFLSGGLDSAAVVGLMGRHSEHTVRTFTIGFAEERYDERNPAAATARFAGTRHEVHVADARDAGLLRRIVRHCGEPFCDSSILPTALLADFTRRHVTVALSGDGGDELFGGYERYRVMALYQQLARIPAPLRRTCCDALLKVLPVHRELRTGLSAVRRLLGIFREEEEAVAFGRFQEIFSADAKGALLAAPARESGLTEYTGEWREALERGSARDFVERFLELDTLRYLPEDLLFKVDIASMMVSLEVRCPFLDHSLIEFVAGLPREYKVTLRARKRLLTAAAGGIVAPEIIRRPKRGFGVPLSAWLRGGLRDDVTEMAEHVRAWDRTGMVNPGAVKRLAAEHLAGICDHGFRLWSLLCLRLWHEEVGSA